MKKTMHKHIKFKLLIARKKETEKTNLNGREKKTHIPTGNDG